MLPTTASAEPTCSVNGSTVTYSGLKNHTGYFPFGEDAFGLVLSTDASEFVNQFGDIGPPGAFYATEPTHDSHFNDPGIPVHYTLDKLKETNPGSYHYTPLSTSC